MPSKQISKSRMLRFMHVGYASIKKETQDLFNCYLNNFYIHLENQLIMISSNIIIIVFNICLSYKH